MRILAWIHAWVHGFCASRKPFDPVNFENNLTWWGKLLHLHIPRHPRLFVALRRFL